MDKKETYKETHRKLVEAMQEAAMKDESIEFDEDAFEKADGAREDDQKQGKYFHISHRFLSGGFAALFICSISFFWTDGNGFFRFLYVKCPYSVAIFTKVWHNQSRKRRRML